jgi:hypothetical protein
MISPGQVSFPSPKRYLPLTTGATLETGRWPICSSDVDFLNASKVEDRAFDEAVVNSQERDLPIGSDQMTMQYAHPFLCAEIDLLLTHVWIHCGSMKCLLVGVVTT